MTGFINTYKYYALAALVAVLVVGWYSDRTAQFGKGVAHCEQKQADAKADYWEERSKRLAEDSKEALKEEQATGSKIRDLSDLRRKEVEREAAKPADVSCGYSDSELDELREIVRQTR